MEPASATYLKRFAIAMIAYLVLFSLALFIGQYLPAQWQPVPIVLVLPTIWLMVRAIRGLWEDSDEFGRSTMQEGFSLGFAIGAPLLLTIGILEVVAGIHIHFLFSFAIIMVAWAIGAAITTLRYR